MVTDTYERALEKEILAVETSNLDTAAEEQTSGRSKRHKKSVS